MNSTSRTASRGGNRSKPDQNTGKSHKSDSKRENIKANDNAKAHASIERNAHTADSASEESSLKQKIASVMSVVNDKTEDEVVTALHDCDNDMDKAVTMLLEGQGRGAWETSGKKKKNRQASASKTAESGSGRSGDQDADMGEAQPLAPNLDRDRSRNRGGGPMRMGGRGGSNSRGMGRGRDNNKENEAVGDDGFRGRGDGYRRGGRGASNGPGGRGSRGGRGGGRLGSRTFQSRDKSSGDRFPSTIDTWNPAGPQESSDTMKMETWGDSFPAAEDWDNEEYTGSLADSKVFTPSALEAAAAAGETIEEASNQDLLTMSTSSAQEYHPTNALPASPLPVGVGTLNSAQAQYLTQLTQQSENLKASASAGTAYSQTESLKNAVGIGNSGAYSQASTYGQTGYGQTGYAPSSFGQTSGSAYGGSASYQQSAGYAANSTPGAYSASSTSYASTTPGYPGTNNSSSFGVYSPTGGANYSTGSYSANVTYDGTTTTSEANVPTAQPPRSKPQRARVPPPSKIPSSAVEMPEDPISASVSSLDVQFGCLEFGSDGTPFDSVPDTKFSQATSTSTSTTADPTGTGVSTTLDNSSTQQPSLDAYSSTGSKTNQQASLVTLTAKGLSNNEVLNIQSSTDNKSNFNSQATRAMNSSSGLDLAKSDVSSLSYPSAPASASYASYQSQKNNSGVYQAPSYSTSSYTAPLTTYSNVTPNSYTSTTYNSQQTPNTFPNSSYGSQPSNVTAVNYASTGGGGSYPSANSFHTSQSYHSGTASVYGASLGYSNNAAATYQNSYSASTSATAKLNANLGTTKESHDYTASTTSSTSTSNATPTLGLTTASQTVTTTSTKVSTGQMKNSVLPSLHPQVMGPQFIMSGASVPFYQAMYNFEDVQLVHPRISHMQPGYYDMSYSAPTSLPAVTGRESLSSVAYTVADARYSTRGDNNASPVPSTLSQQTATAAHQQPMINPSFPPGYTYVYTGGYPQYGGALYPIASAGSAHGTSSSQYGKPSGYGSTYGSTYDGLNQATEYSKSGYVSGSGVAGKAGVATAGSSVSGASDLYGKPHTALGKVNSYDKQAFHSATPPPFNIAGGQSTGMPPSGAYVPPVFIPAMPPHQQHHGTALIQSHLQDSTSNSGQRTQSAAQTSKSGNKQSYGHQYWSTN